MDGISSQDGAPPTRPGPAPQSSAAIADVRPLSSTPLPSRGLRPTRVAGGGAARKDVGHRWITDLLLKVNPTAAVLPVFKNLTLMIAEAKCHKKPPSTELINEFVGVLSQHSTTFGVLFVFATSRVLDHECRVAIALQQKGGVSIVPIGRKQLGQVIAGQPFLRILHDQHIDSMVHSTKLAI